MTDLVNSWFIAKGVLIVANQVLANAGLDPTGITTSIASGAVAAAELALLTFENSINDIVGARASCTLDIVENVRLTLNDIRETVDNIEETVDENRIFVEFLWCPYTQEQQDGTTLIGQGCDTMDNNCNSDILVNPQKKRVVSEKSSLVALYYSRHCLPFSPAHRMNAPRIKSLQHSQ